MPGGGAAEKAYLRLVEVRNTKIKSAEVRASDLNQRHADWIYIVSDDVIDKIRPDINLGTAAATPTNSAGDLLKAAISDAKEKESLKADSDTPEKD